LESASRRQASALSRGGLQKGKKSCWNCGAHASSKLQQTSKPQGQPQRQRESVHRSTSTKNGRGTAKGKTKNDEKKEEEESRKIQLKNTAEEG
jgi:hypothetical protein